MLSHFSYTPSFTLFSSPSNLVQAFESHRKTNNRFPVNLLMLSSFYLAGHAVKTTFLIRSHISSLFVVSQSQAMMAGMRNRKPRAIKPIGPKSCITSSRTEGSIQPADLLNISLSTLVSETSRLNIYNVSVSPRARRGGNESMDAHRVLLHSPRYTSNTIYVP